MNRPGVIWLIKETARTRGVHDTATDEERKVLCTVKSVTRSEYYTALNAGVMPEFVFRLALAEDYQNERIVIWRGQKFRVVRTYVTEDDGIEITVERSDERGTDENNAGS